MSDDWALRAANQTAENPVTPEIISIRNAYTIGGRLREFNTVLKTAAKKSERWKQVISMAKEVLVGAKVREVAENHGWNVSSFGTNLSQLCGILRALHANSEFDYETAIDKLPGKRSKR